jgi:serine/threonine-protein kinase
MAPEQVLGQKDMIDERTDLYSLNVLFYEFLNLKHPLEHKTSLQDMLFGVLHEDAVDSEKQSNPHQGPVPRELCFFLRKGLKKKPTERFQHVDDMIEELQANLEGRICVYCPSTFLKRSSHMTGHFMDNHRFQGPIYAGLLLIVLGIGFWQTAVLLMGLFS